MVAALCNAGHPASVSHSAATFVCNHRCYGLQHRTKRRRGVRSGFMHLCTLPGQAGNAPSPPLAAMIEGIAIARAAALATRDGLASAEGNLA